MQTNLTTAISNIISLSSRLFFIFILCGAALLFHSCDMMHEDREDCPYGLYVKFKYDYNLQRADMFDNHVQSVSLFVFDESGNFVKEYSDGNSAAEQPLECPCYKMHITDLAPGRYKFIALATTPNPKDPTLDSDKRAKFRMSGLPTTGGGIPTYKDFGITLDHTDTIPHRGLPLDTLWHGIDMRGIYVKELTNINPVYDTISLVRDTKQILITIADLRNPVTNDIANYDMKIVDRNAHLFYDNTPDANEQVTYTPFQAWNVPRNPDDSSAGTIAQAQFMTSRIVDYEDNSKDAMLQIYDKRLKRMIVNENLPYLLSYLRSFMDREYSSQEFLDRAYDYNIEFIITETGALDTYVSVKVLSWKKVQVQHTGL